tara:strand:- start:259 stop:1521 length:1263 start_codon:yes stop_codon:yes gene_type:complete
MKASKDNATYISNTINQEAADTDWLEANNTTLTYQPNAIIVSSTDTTSTSLGTATTVATGDQIKVFNADDEIVNGTAGTTSSITVSGSLNFEDLNGYLRRSDGTFVTNSNASNDLSRYPHEYQIGQTVTGSHVLIPTSFTNLKFTLQLHSEGNPSAGPAQIRFFNITDTSNSSSPTPSFWVTGTGGNGTYGNYQNNNTNTYELDLTNNTLKYNNSTVVTTNINKISIYGGYSASLPTFTWISGGGDDQSGVAIDISSFNLTIPPTKAFFNQTPTVSIHLEEDANRILLKDEDLTKVSSTTTEFVGTSSRTGLIKTGDSVVLDSTTTVTLTNVAETASGGNRQYTCTFATQSSAPTTLTIQDRSTPLVLDTESFDNINDEFDLTFRDVSKRARAVAYKIVADNNVDIKEPLQTQFKKDNRQ